MLPHNRDSFGGLIICMDTCVFYFALLVWSVPFNKHFGLPESMLSHHHGIELLLLF